MKIYIKNMVTIRCKMIVKSVLADLGLSYNSVELGEAEVKDNITDKQRGELKTALLKYGLELLEDPKAVLINKIKNVIVEMVHYEEELPKIKNSVYIARKLKHSYTYLSNIFSEVTGTSIQQFILAHKIERIKELLLYDELSIKQISYQMNYSSEAHLTNQFKKITGLTPNFFRHLKNKRMLALDKVGIINLIPKQIIPVSRNQNSSVQSAARNFKINQKEERFTPHLAIG